jgi:protein-disulfide isomerase
VIAPGTRVGKYEVKRLLGQGGFGMVYVAHDTALDRECALKFLLPEHTSRSEILQRFLKEARSAAKIKHGGIVTVFECGVVDGAGPGLDGMAFIAMELLEGESLQARLGRPLAIEHAVEIVRQVASALGAAHATGIVHRDLKPDNIYLVPDPATALGERVKVLDFGIAKLVDEQGSAHKTSTHMIFGTPRYMSPEQCKSSARVDERSDIYALGCILFEMVCGRPPFEGDTGELIGRHQFVPPPVARSIRPDLPDALDGTIAAMLAKRPEDRPQTMAEVLRRLGARASVIAAAAAPTADGSATPPAATPVPELAGDSAQLPVVGPIVPVAPGGGRPWWIYATLGGVVVAGAVTVGVLAVSEAPIREEAIADTMLVERPDPDPRDDDPRKLVERLVVLRQRANALIADRRCGELAAIQQEARAAAPLLGRELDRLGCAVPRPHLHGPDPSDVHAVPIDGNPSVGAADAKVTLVKFTEYACRFCERMRSTIADLQQRYGRDLRVVYKHMIVHRSTATAAAHAFCAAERQGKAREMDRLLWDKGFAHSQFDLTGSGQDCWDAPAGCPIVVGFAREIGLDLQRFKADMRGTCVDRVRRDMQEGTTLGVRGTPSFFINGRFLSGAQPIENFAAVIDEELGKATERIAQGTAAADYYAEWVMGRGKAQYDTPKDADISAPDPLETTGILARDPAPRVGVRHIAIGWDGSSRDPRAKGRSKADADTIVKGLIAMASAGRDLADAATVLSEDTTPSHLAVVRSQDRGAWQELALRLAEGEAGLVRSPRGWHFVHRHDGPRAPLDVAAPPADATRTASGLAYKVLAGGHGGAQPRPSDRVQVHYSGWTTDGTLFDSSRTRGQPAVFPLNAVIAGWTEGVQLMSVGDTVRLWIPEHLAYQGRAGAPAGMLVFDIELLAINP